jgi:Outer membrane receptor proteins, mostly Fe transport
VLAMACYLTWSLPASAQDRTIRGKIVSASGGPVIGASVSVKGGSAGSMTDGEGQFTIRASKGDVLVISSVGFANKEVTVGDEDQVNIELTPAAQEIGEVVVVGYGTQRKEAITGSVASISGARMREVPSANISQALQGRIAGVELSQTSTRPGATMQIRIRGTRSLSADNNPLIVLDGIPFIGSLADLNPNDIKSIEILKDASATAIYGSRGANGVILVTTDKGVRGRSARVNYSGYVGAQKVFAKYPMMNGPEFVKLRAARGQ